MRIVCDCEKIRQNAAAVVALCAPHGIAVVGVTKCVCGEPEVGRAMLAGGCVMLAESRLDNIRRLRAGGIEAPVMLLRLPALSEVDEVVALAAVQPRLRGRDGARAGGGSRAAGPRAPRPAHGRDRRPPRGRDARRRGRRRSRPQRPAGSRAGRSRHHPQLPLRRAADAAPPAGVRRHARRGRGRPRPPARDRLRRPHRQPPPHQGRSSAGALQPGPRRRSHPDRHRLLHLGRPRRPSPGCLQGLRRGHRGPGQALGARRRRRARRLHARARVAGPRGAAPGDPRPRRDRPRHGQPHSRCVPASRSSAPAQTTSSST